MKSQIVITALALLLSAPLPVSGQVEIDAENYTNPSKSTQIDLTDRGCDYVAAFCRLQDEHPHGNIFAMVKGVSYDHIRDMSAMPSKSMVMLSYGKYGTHRSKVVHVEDIEEIGVRGVSRSPIHVYFPQTTDHVPHDHHHIHDVDDAPNHRVHPNTHINQVPHHHHCHPPCTECDECDECDRNFH
ncbi:hypothetical protein SCG7086_BF_00080 [Chlamydiales bacterium SCGC AG-110-P3]|nr:hypothetical protein SCG7086_BF_00080 [Chlamydiales bacterium SCGC AG-110-P3]